MDATCSDSATPEARICDYWIRRKNGLSEREWTDFYQLVTSLLMHTRLDSEYADAERRRDLIDVFFTERIFLNAETSAAGPLESAYALHRYLKNFAVSLRRRTAGSGALAGNDAQAAEEDEGQRDDGGEGAAASLPLTQRLVEAGISPERAGLSANAFLASLEAGEIAYLRHHTCEDEPVREPISSIARRLALGSSYHYKARLLGITRSKGETYVGYEKTKIGAWLLSLGAELSLHWQEELAILLVILCHQALARETR